MAAPARVVLGAVVMAAGLLWHGGGHPGRAGAGGLHAATETALLMAAMMLPLAALSVGVVAERSLAARRSRAVAEHAAGFGLVWFGFGLAAVPVASAAPFAALLALAVAWQLSPLRERYAARCGRLRTAPPSGWRAETATVVGGVDQAMRCVRTCWASMLAMAAAPHVGLMAVVLGISLSEWAPGPNPFAGRRARRPAALYAGLLVLSLV